MKTTGTKTTGAIATEKSQNRKTGPVSATYASQATCPTTCPFRGSGCYAESGPTAIITRRLSRSTAGQIEVARQEAAAIRGLSGTRPLRIHVVGDCATDEAAKIVAAAAADHAAPSWTYTHAWATVARASWGETSVVASCETTDEIRAAHARGYATCIVVARHPSRKVYEIDGCKIVPCPAESVEGVTCATCGICTRDTKIREKGLTVGFAAHGSGTKKAVAAIERKGG